MNEASRMFIGWDSREPIADDVAKSTAPKHASIPLDIQPVKLDERIKQSLYSREITPPASTEFTYSRCFPLG